MAKVVLLSCVSQKLSSAAPAEKLYISSLFKISLRYAKLYSPDKILILSALHGVVKLTDVLEPYNVTLCAKAADGCKVLTKQEKAEWGANVIQQLATHCNTQSDEFIVLAGKAYLNPIQHALAHIQEPLMGLGIGKRMGFMLNEINKQTSNQHSLFI